VQTLYANNQALLIWRRSQSYHPGGQCESVLSIGFEQGDLEEMQSQLPSATTENQKRVRADPGPTSERYNKRAKKLDSPPSVSERLHAPTLHSLIEAATVPEQLDDATLLSLIEMVVRNCVRFEAVDSQTFSAFLNKNSNVGSKPRKINLTERSKDCIFIPFHHVHPGHWTLVCCDRHEEQIRHYDSLGLKYPEAETQVKSFLSWYADFNASEFEFFDLQVIENNP
jgi:hypothetical protein